MSIACGCTNIQVPTGAQGPTGPTGATGAAGTNGINGVALLTNQYPDLSTSGTSWESLIYTNNGTTPRTPYVMALGTLGSNGDAIEIEATFITNAPTNSTFKGVRITFNGSDLSSTSWSLGSSYKQIELKCILTRTSNTTASYELYIKRYTSGTNYILESVYNQPITSIAGLNFVSTAYNIDAQGDSATMGDITCTVFRIKKYKI